MYKIILNDGTELKNLELNGNNFISSEIIEDSVFKDNLKNVSIYDGEVTDTYTDMTLVANRVIEGRSWFILGEKSEQDKVFERINVAITTNEDSITDVQMALAEVYEMILGGM